MVNSRMFDSDVQVTLPRTHAWISKRQEHECSKSHNEIPCVVVVGWLSYPMEEKKYLKHTSTLWPWHCWLTVATVARPLPPASNKHPIMARVRNPSVWWWTGVTLLAGGWLLLTQRVRLTKQKKNLSDALVVYPSKLCQWVGICFPLFEI